MYLDINGFSMFQFSYITKYVSVSIYYKNVDINSFDVFERDIRHYSDFGKIAVVGDLNARTGLSNDHFEG